MRHAPRERNIFSLGLAGVATPQPNTLSVAAPLANLSNRDVADVKIDLILLARAPVQTALPMTVGAIRARSSTIVEAELNSQSLVSGHSYPLLMRGTYGERGGRYDERATRRFTVYTSVIVPPPSEGSGQRDQIIQYAPSIDRFIWILQGTGYHLAMASPADIKNSNGTAWTYWNLTPSLFGKCNGPDYPDLSIGDSSLYMSWDAGGGTGCTAGFQVVRTSLAGIQAGGTITLDFTDPANAPQSKVWGEHLTQNTGDEIFWAGHNGNTKLTVYSLKEGSNTYFWRDVGVSSWANNAPTSTTPDNQDWLAKNFNSPGGNSFPRNGIIGAARSGNQLWFGWSAGTDNNFKQAHVEIVTLDRANNFNKTQQVQVWNNSYAFAYPAFSSNGCTGELGMSFEYGGNGNFENHVVGFWGDFVAYITSDSNAGTDRFGDYVTIRRAPPTTKDPGNLFTAFGFGVNKQTPPSTGKKTDVRYVVFGRPSCPVIQ